MRSGLNLSFLRDLPLTRAAAQFARDRHRSQRRQADSSPFILHPLEVASALQRSGYPDHVIAAAVLHDVLEDTPAGTTDLRSRFGGQITELVALVSDDSTINDEEARKDDTRDHVRNSNGDALVIYAADKVSKVRELRTLRARGLSQAEAEAKLRHYQKCLQMLDEALPHNSLVDQLRFELETLEQLPPQPDQGCAGNRLHASAQ
jgi:(p)ppGpp synthase/HD superfamily hydrolase